jgi:hypothetical protein
VEILQTENNAANEKFDYMLRKLFVSTDLKAEISSWHVVHDKIKIKPVLESEDHVDDEGMFEFSQEFSLVEDRLDAFLRDNAA